MATLLGVDPARAKRVTFTEITRDAILEAFTHPRAIDLKLFDAQEARRILDRLVGYRISPILWRRVRPGLSAGRVQSVAVRLIVEREREIRAFVPGGVLERRRPAHARGRRAAVRRPARRDPRGASWPPSPDKKGVLLAAEADAATHAERLGRAGLPRRQRRAKERKRSPAAAVHDLDPAAGGRAQARVQRPQDDVGRPAPVRGHRPARRGHASGSSPTCGPTPSPSPTPRCARSPSWCKSEYGDGLRARRAPPVQDKRSRTRRRRTRRSGPTSAMRTPQRVARGARPRPAPPLHADLAAHGGDPDGRGPLQPGGRRHRGDGRATRTYGLRATGQTMIFDGFIRVYKEGRDEGPTRTPRRRCPSSPPSRSCACSRSCPSSTSRSRRPGSPRPRWSRRWRSSASAGPSTYASIIDTIQRPRVRHAWRTSGSGPTDVGEVVTDKLIEHFPDVVDVNFTAYMEKELDDIAEGRLRQGADARGVQRPVRARAREGRARVRALQEELDEDCPALPEGGARARPSSR